MSSSSPSSWSFPPIDLNKVWGVNGPDALVILTLRALMAQSFVILGWMVVGETIELLLLLWSQNKDSFSSGFLFVNTVFASSAMSPFLGPQVISKKRILCRRRHIDRNTNCSFLLVCLAAVIVSKTSAVVADVFLAAADGDVAVVAFFLHVVTVLVVVAVAKHCFQFW